MGDWGWRIENKDKATLGEVIVENFPEIVKNKIVKPQNYRIFKKSNKICFYNVFKFMMN